MAAKSRRGTTGGEESSLRRRVPNPPPIFEGRQREVAWLRDSLTRFPLSVVWGLGGLGKSALVLKALQQAFPEQRDQALFIPLRPGQEGAPALAEMVRALCEARGISQVDWPALISNEEAMIAAAIDLAESEGAWLVIENLEHLPSDLVRRLLTQIGRYARRSRWIATSRLDPQIDELAGQVLPLAGLAPAALARIARQCAPGLSAEEVEGAVAGAGSSPWRLRQRLGAELDRATDDPVLRGLPAELRALVDLLATVEPALPADVLSALFPMAEGTLDRLEQQGILERRSNGWRLHEVARTLWEAGARKVDTGQHTSLLADELATREEPVLQVEALRLWIGLGRTGAASQLLEARGDPLFAAGYALPIWRCLEHSGDRSLARFRLRCAAELGSDEVIDRVELPDAPTAGERMLWSRALFAAGRLAEAGVQSEAAMVAAEAEHDPNLAFQAKVLSLFSRSVAAVGEREDLLSTLAMLSPTAADPEGGVAQEAFAAKCYGFLGEYATALKIGRDAARRLLEIEPPRRVPVLIDVLVLQLLLGRMGDATGTMDALQKTGAGTVHSLFEARYLGVLRVNLATHSGRLAEARDLLARLLPFSGRSLVHRPILTAQELHLKMVAGEFEGVGPDLARVAADFNLAGNRYLTQWAAGLESLLRRNQARPEAPLSEGVGESWDENANGHMLGLLRLLHRTRQHPLGADERGFLARFPPGTFQHATALQISAQSSLLEGADEVALQQLPAAVAEAAQLGHGLCEADGVLLWCTALLAAGRNEELAHAAAELVRLGNVFPSARLQAEAAFFAMAANGGAVDPATLERLAGLESTAPVAARCAQSLLGGTPSIDAIDRRVLGALASRPGWRIQLAVPAPPGRWVPGWGLDGLRHQIWLPRGKPVDLSPSPVLWACLEALASLGGSASREALVPAIWPGERYHPLVHDNRLNPAIRKLRLAIEVDPAAPRRLITTAGGYGFGTGEPVRWLKAPPPDGGAAR